MRLIENSDERFILEERPMFLGLAFIFFMLSCAGWAINALVSGDYLMAALAVVSFVAIGVFAMAVVERTWFIFDRTKDTIEFRRRSSLSFESEVLPLRELEPDGIIVQGSEDSNRLAVKLVSREQPIPLTQQYTSGNDAYRFRDAAKAWLAA